MTTVVGRRRLGAIATALVTAVVAALASGAGADLQPIVLPVVFGVALATAIDPKPWLLHLGLVAAGILLSDILSVLTTGSGFRAAVDLKALASALVPAFIGAAMVRLACRSAM